MKDKKSKPIAVFRVHRPLIWIWRISGAFMILFFGSLGVLNLILSGDMWYLSLVCFPWVYVGFVRGHYHNAPDVVFYSDRVRCRGFLWWYGFDYQEIDKLAMHCTRIANDNHAWVLFAKTTSNRVKRILVPGTLDRPEAFVDTLVKLSQAKLTHCESEQEFKGWKKS